MNKRASIPSFQAQPRNASRWLLGVSLSAVLSLGLVACGGGTTGNSAADTKGATAAQSSSEQSAASVQAELSKGAALSEAELAAAEKAAEAADTSGSSVPLEEVKEGQTVPKSAYTSGEVARKAAVVRIPVYRFYNGSTGAHFFTTSASERDKVKATMSPPYSYEGPAFSVASGFAAGLSAVHRFYNTQTGVHFYTISESERANVVANLPQFSYEGVAYYASQVSGAGLIPFHRFYVSSKGFHFYTANEAEKAKLIANASATYHYEGVGYYVLDTDWRAEKLPHSGITDQQCYQAGSDVLLECSRGETSDLNPQQDGHRTAVNAMSYSAMGNRALTSCVKDNVTGLIWEGKTDDGGLRDKDNTYTNLNNGQSYDASGYVAAVNAVELCGYSDWRLPTMRELQSIVDYGRSDPSINTTWFPNTKSVGYWSSEGNSTNSGEAWVLGVGYSQSVSRSNARAVRLVRGASPSGPRFTYSTVAYGSDATNNVVNDAWTGLQWRRCEEGRTWTGSTCSGTTKYYKHEQALAHAKKQSGWRLPNVKELSSLVDLSVTSGARINAMAFPGADDVRPWTSSPFMAVSGGGVWVVTFASGLVFDSARNSIDPVRLVRASQ